MLVLTRKQRQQITIGDSITVTILRVKGQSVRIGIEAPDGVRILRAELSANDETVMETEPKTTRSTSRRGSMPSDAQLPSAPNRAGSRLRSTHSGAAPLAGLVPSSTNINLLSMR